MGGQHMRGRIGKQSLCLEGGVTVKETYCIGGAKEGQGPLSGSFDMLLDNDYFGEKSWEKAESRLQREAVSGLLKKSKTADGEVACTFAGDLINQCISASYAMRSFNIPFLGLFGACSTMTESLLLGAVMISGGFADKTICATSSHFCSAEKQFRFPLEYGGQRTPTSQWTVTGAGAALLSSGSGAVKITHATLGKVIDMGITDANNMGAAMAPAAADTLTAHFEDTGFTPSDYDLILTGDLGVVGSDILCDLMNRNGYDIYTKHNDCGKMIFDLNEQEVNSGGSGCGCCASVFCGHVFKEMKEGRLKRVLLAATGALMNPMIVQQGESIPGISHALTLEAYR